VTVRLIPLFPLPLVLFPKAPLPLHIFEPRYRRLVTDCLAGDRLLGIICNPENASERDIPSGTVGCVAHIDTVEELPDGRSNILVSGVSRFTLQRFVADPAPYNVAEISSVEDVAEPHDVLVPLGMTAGALFERVGKSARAIADDAAPLPELPADPVFLSFAIAQYVDLDLDLKQSLLASQSPSQRLRQLIALLSGVVDRVEARAVVHVRARGNGHGRQAELS
jgi:Lon protease-like protein